MKTAYKTICEQHPEIPVFSQYWWMDAVCAEWDVAIATKGSHTKGVWAYPLERKPGVTLIRTPQLTPYMGPTVFYPSDMKESNRDSYEHDTVAELLKQLPDANVWNLSMPPNLMQAGIFKNYGLQQSVQQTFLIDLAPDEATLLGNLKDTLRKNIRQATSEITITNSPELLPQLYDFYKHTLTRKGKAVHISLTEMQGIFDASIAHNAGALWVAQVGNKILGILWHVWDSQCSYSLCMAQNPDTDNSKAMSALVWHAIKDAKARGQQTFDLEGSMDEGVERFNRGFGGRRSLYLVLSKNTSPIWKLKQMIRG